MSYAKKAVNAFHMVQANHMARIHPRQARIEANLRVLYYDGVTLYASRGTRIFSSESGHNWEYLARLEMPFPYKQMSHCRLTQRLGRAEIYKLHRSERHLVALAKGGVYGCRLGEPKLRLVHRVTEGSRPVSLSISPGNAVIFGEYFSNNQRRPVRIFRSDDLDRWDIVHEFPAGDIRHVHGIYYDRYATCFWVLVGDYNHEPGIARASVDFDSVEFIKRGAQNLRVYSVICRPDGLYYATDTEQEPNGVYFMSRDGAELRKLHEMEGSVLHSGQFGDWMFFATVCEPSKVNDTKNVHVWATQDGTDWIHFACYRKDPWSFRFFQYGNLFFPEGHTEMLNEIIYSGTSIWGLDGSTAFAPLPNSSTMTSA